MNWIGQTYLEDHFHGLDFAFFTCSHFTFADGALFSWNSALDFTSNKNVEKYVETN